MCFPADAVPPIEPIEGAAVDSELVTLTSKDGTPFAAFVARAAKAGGAGMVILPDVRGLFHFYEELALRFAEEGITAIAYDFFGRTAGVGRRDADFPYMEHVRQTKMSQVAEDTGAAAAYLRSAAGGNCSSVFTVGFCYGGSSSWLQAAAGHGLAGSIGFYGRPTPSFVDNSPGPADRAKDMTCPILALFGGADQGIPQESIDMFDAALTAAGVKHEVVVYPGAPHSFFDRAYEQYAEASADAWKRCLAFVRGNAK